MQLKEVTRGTWQPPAVGPELGKVLLVVHLLLPKEVCVPAQLPQAEWQGHCGNGPPQGMYPLCPLSKH